MGKKMTARLSLAALVVAAALLAASCGPSDTANLIKLKAIMAVANASLPEDLGEGLTLKSAAVEDGNVLYMVDCDEDIYDMDVLEESIDGMRAEIKESLRATEGVEELTELCAALHADVVYRYVGDQTGQSVDVTIPYSELP